MGFSDLEFIFKPHYCETCMFTKTCWGEVALMRTDSGNTLQQLVFPVRRGSTVHGFQLVPHMQQLTAMFMSTTRGLSA